MGGRVGVHCEMDEPFVEEARWFEGKMHGTSGVYERIT